MCRAGEAEKHTIELVIDRLTLAPSERARLTDSVEDLAARGKGQCACSSTAK